MSLQRIKRDDIVIAVSGVNAGKSGKVLQVRGDRAIVEQLNLRKKTLRRTQDNPNGGIAEIERPLHISNLMPYCPECKRGVRISRVEEDGTRKRKCRRCGHIFDN